MIFDSVFARNLTDQLRDLEARHIERLIADASERQAGRIQGIRDALVLIGEIADSDPIRPKQGDTVGAKQTPGH